MPKLRILGVGVIGLGAGSAYLHGSSWGIWFASVCLVVGLVLIVASEATSMVLKPRGAKANPGGPKPAQIVVLVKGEVQVYPQRDGKFQEVDDPNQTGFEFDVFTYCWLVHGAELSVGIDDLYLSLKGADGSSKTAERIAGDLKNWHLRVEGADEDESDGMAGTATPLAELDTAAPLKCGVAREGWVHFRIRDVSPSELKTGSLELSVWDTFSQVHTAVASRARHLPGNIWPIPPISAPEPDSKKDEPPEVADGKLAN